MTNLTTQNNQQFIDSREIAEMMGKDHKYVLRDIEGTDDVVGILPTLESANLHYQNYFIKSSYKAGTREYKCYLVTKMGCEMLGNKQQGEKGILFTAKYVERFNQMEDTLRTGQIIEQFSLPKTYTEALAHLLEKEKEKEALLENIKIKEIEITEMKPDADFGKAVASSEGSLLLADFAMELQKQDVMIGKKDIYLLFRLLNITNKDNSPKAYYSKYFEIVLNEDKHSKRKPTYRLNMEGAKYFLEEKRINKFKNYMIKFKEYKNGVKAAK